MNGSSPSRLNFTTIDSATGVVSLSTGSITSYDNLRFVVVGTVGNKKVFLQTYRLFDIKYYFWPMSNVSLFIGQTSYRDHTYHSWS